MRVNNHKDLGCLRFSDDIQKKYSAWGQRLEVRSTAAQSTRGEHNKKKLKFFLQ